MYLPAYFAVADLRQIAEFVDRAGAAELVTFDGTAPAATLMPVIWDRPPGWDEAGRDEAGRDGTGRDGAGRDGAGRDGAGPGESGLAGFGRLLGHMALVNPQWQSALPDVLALAIVAGPQAYISPSWYESAGDDCRAVPTWNYTTVHLTGPVTFHQDLEWLRDVVTRLTDRHEAGRAGRWRVHDAPEKFIAGRLRAIVGVEMRIERVEAKDKLSQDRPAADRPAVITALRSEPEGGAHAIADLMASREPASGTGG